MTIFRDQVAKKPAYVPGKPVSELQREFGVAEAVKLASNENPLGPSPLAVAAVQRAALEMNAYPDDYGLCLKEKLSAFHSLPVNRIVLGNGGTELLKMTAETFINEGDEAVMSTVTYAKYATEVEFLGGVAVRVPHKDYGADIPAMLAAVTPKTKLVFLCNPNNPTGRIATGAEVAELVHKTPSHVTVVLDEAYYHYAMRNPDYIETQPFLAERENLVILRTFSKIAGLAGARIGYAMTSEAIADAMNRTKLTFGVNNFALAAGMAALEDAEHIRKTVEANAESLGMMQHYFEANGIPYVPTSANFIFFDTGLDGRTVYRKLLEKGVILRGGFLWKCDTWLRASSGTVRQTEIFLNALTDVLKDMKG